MIDLISPNNIYKNASIQQGRKNGTGTRTPLKILYRTISKPDDTGNAGYSTQPRLILAEMRRKKPVKTVKDKGRTP